MESSGLVVPLAIAVGSSSKILRKVLRKIPRRELLVVLVRLAIASSVVQSLISSSMLLILSLPRTERNAYSKNLNTTRLVPVIADSPTARSTCIGDIPVRLPSAVMSEANEKAIDEEGLTLLLLVLEAATDATNDADGSVPPRLGSLLILPAVDGMMREFVQFQSCSI